MAVIEKALREKFIVLPGLVVLERIIGNVRIEAEASVFKDLVKRVSAAERRLILKMMEPEPVEKTSRFQQFQQNVVNKITISATQLFWE